MEHGFQGSVELFHHPVALRMVDSGVHFSDPKKLTHVLHKVGQQVGPTVR